VGGIIGWGIWKLIDGGLEEVPAEQPSGEEAR
jgi:hypothetical protein